MAIFSICYRREAVNMDADASRQVEVIVGFSSACFNFLKGKVSCSKPMAGGC